MPLMGDVIKWTVKLCLNHHRFAPLWTVAACLSIIIACTTVTRRSKPITELIYELIL